MPRAAGDVAEVEASQSGQRYRTLGERGKSQREVTIPVVLEKNEQFELDDQGRLAGHKLIPKISIKNPGKADKIWDLNVALQNEIEESLAKQFFIQELNAQEEWAKEFPSDVELAPPISLWENVSNLHYLEDKQDRLSPILIKNIDNVLYYTVSIENRTDKEIFNIEVFKRLPTTILKVLEYESTRGDLDLNRRNLIMWKIGSLGPRQSAQLRFKISVSTKPVSSGKIELRYFVREQFTDFNVLAFNGLARMGDFMTIRERDEEPEVWDCSASFSNRSEFSVQISQFKIRDKDKQDLVFFDLEAPISLAPGQNYEFDAWQVRSKDRPSFHKTLDYSIKYEESFVRSGILQLADIPINVIDLETRKTLTRTTFDSYTEITDAVCQVAIKNMSSVPLNHLFLRETIPKGFQPPNWDDVKITIAGEEFDWQELDVSSQVDTFHERRDQLELQLQSLSIQIDESHARIQELELKKKTLQAGEVQEDLSTSKHKLKDLNKDVKAAKKQLQALQAEEKKALAAKKKLTGTLEDTRAAIQEFEELRDVKQTIKEYQTQKEQLDAEIKKVQASLFTQEDKAEAAHKQVESLTKKHTDLEKKAADLEKKQKATEKAEDQAKKAWKANKADDKLKAKYNKLKDEVKQIKKDASSVRKEIKALSKDLDEQVDLESEAKDQVAQIKKTLEKLKADLAQKEEKMKNLEEKAKSSANMQEIASKISTHEKKLEQLQADREKAKKGLVDIQDRIQSGQEKLENLQLAKTDLSKRVKDQSSLKKESDKLQSEIVSSQDDISKAQEEREKLQGELDEVTTKIKNMTEQVEIDDDFDKKFDQLCSDQELSLVQLRRNPDEMNHTVTHDLFVVLIRLNAVAAPLAPDEEFVLEYPVRTPGLKPTEDYQFPTFIACNSLPLSVAYKFRIPEQNLPSIEIQHKRRRISVGRIIDHYREAGRFYVSLIVRNESDEPVDNIQIFDTIPEGATISNAEYEFNLAAHEREGLQRVIWKLTKLNPYEEVEVNYLLALGGEQVYNVNDMDLTIN